MIVISVISVFSITNNAGMNIFELFYRIIEIFCMIYYKDEISGSNGIHI